MNFLLSANNHYIVPLTVCLTSILENHKDYDLNFYILQNDFPEKSRNIIKELARNYNKSIHIIDIPNFYYDSVPVLRWSKETYYRLLFNEFLPRDLDRIIYLDSDIIVDKDISNLYNLDLEEYCMAALPETHNIDIREKLGLNKRGQYFQAGVLLFDLTKCREVINYEKSLEIINKLGENLTAVDQDVINIAFDGKIKVINDEFNNSKITAFNGNNFYRLLNFLPKKDIENTRIFHYASGKPWNNLFSGSAEKIWYKYLLLSPYADLYKKKFRSLKYKILRTGIMKYLFFLYTDLTPYIDKFFRKMLSQDKYVKVKDIYRKYIK